MTRKIKSIFSIFFYLVIAGLFFSGCGGGGGDSAPVTAPTSHTPVISNLQYSPQSATQNQGNGEVTITGAINFTDQGGDIKTVTLNAYTAQGMLQGVPLDTQTSQTQGLSGVVSGVYSGTVVFNTTTVGDFTLEIYVTDVAGNSSNRLTGTFSVTAPADPLYEKTLLLRGKWHFVYTIISIFTNDYSLSTISGTKNSQGGYYIYGTGQYGDLVVAGYWPTDGNWSLFDDGTIIDRFYTFYTDGATILGNSCYYQIDKSTGNWSRCYPLSGSKTSPTPDNIFDKQDNSMIEREEELLLENTTFVPIDDDTRDKYLQLKNSMNHGGESSK